MSIQPNFTFKDGRTINRIGFGAMRLTGQPGNFGPYENWGAGKSLLRHAAEIGVDHFDTARAYGPGHSERLLADAFGKDTKSVFIATKGGINKSGPRAELIKRDGRPEALRTHIENSLIDLGVDQIDLYYLHAPDRIVPIEESLGALAEAKTAGKIARIGVSNVTLDELERALSVSWIDAVQNRYNPAEGGDEAVLDFTTAHGIAFVPWGPLGANPMKRGAPLAGPTSSNRGYTSAQLALRNLLGRAPNVLPIPGTTSIAHLQENVGALREPLQRSLS